MINGPDIKNINLSWLYHFNQALSGQVAFNYQICDLRAANSETFDFDDETVIVSPMTQWGPTDDSLGLLATFAFAVIVRQAPGDVLKAFSRNVEIQQMIEQALYGSERLLVDSMDTPEFAIPWRSFDANGNPTGIINPEGLRYVRGLWSDRTPDGEFIQSWTTQIEVSIY